MPGISASRIGIGLNRGLGVNWSSYWATLISATVETAAPTHVVLTFPTAQTSLGASDFTIAGFTVSSVSWTGAVLTLVLSYAVTAYAGNLTITFVTTGETATVTNNVAIANTVGWYAAGNGSATYVTKDGSDFVSVWKDLSGANHPLNQTSGTNQPKWEADGILFDGDDNYLKADSFTYNQPYTIYFVGKQLSWTNYDYIMDGGDVNKMIVSQITSTPTIRLYAGTAAITTDKMTLNQFAILRIVGNGASSKMQINNNAAVVGNIGSDNPGGITVACSANTSSTYKGHIKVREIILRSGDDSDASEIAIYNYLANKYGLTLI